MEVASFTAFLFSCPQCNYPFENLNKPRFTHFLMPVNEPTFAGHIKKLLHPNSWATQMELIAAVTLSSFYYAPAWPTRLVTGSTSGNGEPFGCCQPIQLSPHSSRRPYSLRSDPTSLWTSLLQQLPLWQCGNGRKWLCFLQSTATWWDIRPWFY